MFGTTRLSKAIAALLILLYAVQFFVPDSSQYLALVPGRTLPLVWNLVTAGFLIVNPLELALSILGLLVLARLVEPIYGSKEFLKFLFLVNLLTCSTVFVAVYITYAVTQSGDLLYTQFTGFHGLVAAMLVAVKQIKPQHEIKLLGALQIRIKYLPSLVMIPVVGLAIGLKYQEYLAFYITATYLSWIYLRFFQQQPESTLCGDASDDFKFSSFFPDFIAPVIDPIAAVLGFITRLRHTPGAEGAAGGLGGKGLHSQGGPSSLGADAADASRRRERGAKALEERLGQKTGAAAPTAAGGDLEAGQ